MRDLSSAERAKRAKELVDSHPWFNELINKVVILNGVQRDVTISESIILNQIQRMVEDETRFTKSAFNQIIRLLPTREFMKDEIQRIVRFVKSHETISERGF